MALFRRILILVILYSILGVVTTVGVAWSYVGSQSPWVDGGSAGLERLSTTDAWYEWSRLRDANWTPYTTGEFAMGYRHGLLGSSETTAYTWNADGNGFFVTREFLCGWPCRAVRAIGRGDTTGAGVLDLEGGWRFAPIEPYADDSLRPIPLRPIFPGFVVNTLFYAAMWFGIFFGIAALRRFIRKKRGRCVKCSYDLRGHRHMALGNGHSGGDSDTTETQMPNAKSRMPSAIGCPECGWGRQA